MRSADPAQLIIQTVTVKRSNLTSNCIIKTCSMEGNCRAKNNLSAWKAALPAKLGSSSWEMLFVWVFFSLLFLLIFFLPLARTRRSWIVARRATFLAKIYRWRSHAELWFLHLADRRQAMDVAGNEYTDDWSTSIQRNYSPYDRCWNEEWGLHLCWGYVIYS